jgi:hypothetical protein
MAREFTARIVELVQEDFFVKDRLIEDILNWMSEDDVKEMVKRKVIREGWIGFDDLLDIERDEDDEIVNANFELT